MRSVKIVRSLKSPLEYLICLLLIYLSGSAMISTNEDASIFRILSILLIGLCVVYWMGFVRSIRSIKSAIFVLIVSIAYFIIELIIFNDTILGFSLRLLWTVAFSLILFSKRVNTEKYLQCIYYLVLTLAFITLIVYFGINILCLDVPYDYVSSGNDLTFYRRYLGFFYAAGIYQRYLPIVRVRVYRLQSLFWEPGVYAIYLAFALFYYIFKIEDKHRIHLIILLFSMILTFSTTGICIAIGLISVHLLRNAKINKASKWILLLPVALVAAIGIFIVWNTKRIESSGVNGSYSLRILDIIYGLRLIIQRPLFGWGYKNYRIFEAAQSLGRGSSNGLITLGYTMGIIGLIIVLIPFVMFPFVCEKNKRVEEIVFSVMFILTNMTEPLIFMPFMIFIVVYQYRKCWYMRFRNLVKEQIVITKSPNYSL